MLLHEIALWVFVLSFVHSSSNDPWDTVQNILSNKSRTLDIIEINSSENTNSKRNIYASSTNIFQDSDTKDEFSFEIPMDYITEHSEQQYALFWQKEASDWQNEVYRLLKESSDQHDNIEATFMISQMHLWGYYQFPYNGTIAFQYLSKFNELTNYSNSTALLQLGVMYSTGLFGAIPIDIAKGLLYYQQAASMGDLMAKQILAYKHLAGVSVPRDVDKALILYRDLSDNLKKSYSTFEWTNVFPLIESYRVRIPDFDNGLLGRGLNTVPMRVNRKKSMRPDSTSSLWTHISGGQVFLQLGIDENTGTFKVEEGDDLEDRLVDVFYTAWDDYKGTYAQSRNTERARKLLELTYVDYNQDVPYMDNIQKYFFVRCLDLLGHMYYTGQGVESPNVTQAMMFFNRSLEIIPNANLRVNVDLGLISHHTEHNITKAIAFYKKAFSSLTNDGIVNYQLAKLSIEHPELKIGDPYVLMQEGQSRGYVPAIYEFARFKEASFVEDINAEDTTYMYKKFVEHNEQIVAPHLRTAFGELLNGNSDTALWAYSIAAEQGYESAQISAAYLMYQLPCMFDAPPITTKERKDLAIEFYTRAFKQGNVDAGVVAGNIFFEMGDYSNAFSMYQHASLKFSPQAVWNLGYMYEHGLSVAKDYYLAKRFYDQLLEFSHKFYIAVQLSVLKLQFKSFIAKFLGEQWLEVKHYNRFLQMSLLSWMKRVFQYIWSFLRNKNSTTNLLDAPRRINQSERGNSLMKNTFGVEIEDLITLLMILGFFIAGVFFRNMAGERGWNVQVNGNAWNFQFGVFNGL